MARLPYALSALRLSGRRRGRPSPARGTRILSMTGSNWVQSARCPGVAVRDSGRQRPSALRWTLVVNPPRERPRPSPAAPPPTGGWAVSTRASRSCVPPRRPPLVGSALTAGFCGRWRHAGGLASRWSRPRCPSRSRCRHRRWPGPAGTAAPRCHRPARADGAHIRSSTARTVPVDPATAPRSVPGAVSR